MSHHIDPSTGDPCFRQPSYKITEKDKSGKWSTGHLCDLCAKEYMARIKQESEGKVWSNDHVKWVQDIIKDEKNKLNPAIIQAASPPRPVPPAVKGIVQHLLKLITLMKIKESMPRVDKMPCPECGTPFPQILNSGNVGCYFCYQHFREELATFVPSLRTEEETFKTPSPMNKKKKRGVVEEIGTMLNITKLKSEMDKAISKEDYERAAKIRDRIKEVEGSNPL